MTKGSFYHHNDNKDDLIADCFARTFAVVRQVQRAAETTGQTGWDRLCTAADELVRYQLSEQGPLLRNSAFSALPEALRHEMKRTMDRLALRFGGLIVEGMVDGSIRPLDPAVAARLIDSMVNAAVEVRRWVPGHPIHTRGGLFHPPLPGGAAPGARPAGRGGGGAARGGGGWATQSPGAGGVGRGGRAGGPGARARGGARAGRRPRGGSGPGGALTAGARGCRGGRGRPGGAAARPGRGARRGGRAGGGGAGARGGRGGAPGVVGRGVAPR